MLSRRSGPTVPEKGYRYSLNKFGGPRKKFSCRNSNPGPSGLQHSCTCYTVPAPQKNPYTCAGIRTPVHPACSTVVRATLSQLPRKILTPLPVFEPLSIRPAAQLYMLHCPSSPEKSLRLCRYSNPCPSGPQHSCTCYTVPAPQKNPYASAGIRTPVHPARSTVVRATLSRLPINS
jgi:hypothetical protein